MNEIRLANAGDLAEIRELVAQAYEPYVARMDRPPAPMLDDYEALVERGVVAVQRDEDGLAGVIVMWAKRDHWYVDNVAAAPSRRGQGVGARLLDYAVEAAAAAGFAEVRLYTNVAMAENIDYYPRHGFVETHRAVENGYERIYFSHPTVVT